MADSPPVPEPQFPGIVHRPPGQLHDFPVGVRWEVTRRNPFYLAFWEQARRYRHPRPDEHPIQTHLHHMAALMLGAVGVFGEPVDPAKPFEELHDEAPDPSFLCGSVQPATLRALVALLVTALPPAERAVVGSLVMESGLGSAGDDEDARLLLQARLLSHLGCLASPALDSVPDTPLFFVHLGASQTTISEDVRSQARLWQSRQGIEPAKVHTAKFGEYLSVWDAREGWAGGGYDRGRERPFADIARESGKPLSTVYRHYRSAFEAVVGVEFTPELWWRTLGKIKFSELFGPVAAQARTQHPQRSPSPRPVPDSVVSRPDPEGRGSVVAAGSVSADDAGLRDLLIDLKGMFARNAPDAEVVQFLGLIDPQEVAQIRERLADFEGLC